MEIEEVLMSKWEWRAVLCSPCNTKIWISFKVIEMETRNKMAH